MSGTAARPSRVSPVADWTATQEFPSPAWLNGADSAFAHARTDRRRIGLLRQATYVAIDIILVCFGAIAVYATRFGMPPIFHATSTPFSHWIHRAYTQPYMAFLMLYVALIVMACLSQHLYRTSRELSALRESFTVAKAVGLATTLLVLFIFISGNKQISRLVVASAGIVNVATLAGWRYSKRHYVFRRAQRGEGTSRTLIVGAGKLGQTLATWLMNNHQLGYTFCGFLDAHPNGDTRVLGSIHDLRKVALEQFVDHVFVTQPAEPELVKTVWVEVRRLRLSLHVVPDIYDGLGWRAPMKSVGGFPAIELHGQPIPAFGLVAKRVIDFVVAAIGLALSAPLLALAAAWIRLDSPGPATYSALRVGRKGKKFRCYKLRTMIDDADAEKERLRKSNERNGPFFKMENDPRITRCGYWLRKYSLDELPQLWNVLRGDMSLVGPRPHPVDDFERYTFEHLRRLDVKPGLTGLWQVTARRDPSFERNMKLDLEYIENWSLVQDLQILWNTIPVVLRGEGN